MVRDYVYSRKTFEGRTETFDYLLNQSTVTSFSAPVTTRFAARDDAVSTVPKNGGYHVPTPYWAFRYGMDSTASDSNEEELWAVFNPCSPYVSVHQGIVKSEIPPKYLLRYGSGDTKWSADWWSIRPNPPGYLESRVTRALQASVQQQGWEVSQTAGELPETVTLLLSASKRLLTSVKYVKQGRLLKALINLGIDEKRAKKTLTGNSANLILEFQYGWKPLMNEIHSLAEAVEYGFNQPISKAITVRKEEVISLDEVVEEGHITYTHSGEKKYVIKAGIKAYVTNDALTSLGSHGLLNPAALAWELFPMSFVINWFVPIGSFLSGLSTHFGMEFRDGYMTKVVEYQRSTVGTNHDPILQCKSYPERKFHEIAGPMGRSWNYNISYSEWLETFERQLMPFPPPPVPYWDPQLNLSKITSILTLLTAIVSK